MKRDLIPYMKPAELLEYAEKIRPINFGTYLRRLNSREINMTAFTWLEDPEDFAEDVNYNDLSVLEDVKMLHPTDFKDCFKPTVAEVICQIPKRLLDKVVAFEIMEGKLSPNGVFKNEFLHGFYVSIVRLYKKYEPGDMNAEYSIDYPTPGSKVPTGISEEQFTQLFNV